ncbi:unnamed protein product [Alopecurus aequalis]
MAKPRAGSAARSAAAAARASPAPTSSDPNLPTPTSIPRADLSAAAKAAVASANRSSVGSSSSASATDLPAPAARDVLSIAKEVGKRLAYDDDADDDPAAALQPEIILDDLAPLLELPDPDDASSSTTVLSASAAADATNASADSTLTQVAAPAVIVDADTEGPLLTEMELVLAELRGARGLTPRSKRLLAALAETASAELSYNPSAAALRMRRAAFWRKVRVGILAATVFSVAAIDAALAFAFFAARHANGRYSHVLPPT